MAGLPFGSAMPEFTMSMLVALLFLGLIGATTAALIRMNRMTCLPCEAGDDSAYCNPPRPRRPS